MRIELLKNVRSIENVEDGEIILFRSEKMAKSYFFSLGNCNIKLEDKKLYQYEIDLLMKEMIA